MIVALVSLWCLTTCRSLQIHCIGDININYLVNSNKKLRLDAMLCLYNLPGKADCPTRIQNKSSTAINNVCIGTFKINNYSISSLFNGLSDNDTQLVMIKHINFQMQNYHIHKIRT